MTKYQQDQDNDKSKEVKNKTKIQEEDLLQGCQRWSIPKKNLKDAHDKHNLKKYPHFAQCTKTIRDEPKMGVWGSKKGLKEWVLVPKTLGEKNQTKRGIIGKIQKL